AFRFSDRSASTSKIAVDAATNTWHFGSVILTKSAPSPAETISSTGYGDPRTHTRHSVLLSATSTLSPPKGPAAAKSAATEDGLAGPPIGATSTRTSTQPLNARRPSGVPRKG